MEILAVIGGLFFLIAILDLFAEDSVGAELVVGLILVFISAFSSQSIGASECPPINRYQRPWTFWILFGLKILIGSALMFPLVSRFLGV